jgi:exonuclease III
MDPDVLCLQEIQGPDTFQALSGGLQRPGAYCPGNEFPQYGGALLWSSGQPVADYAAAAASPQRMWQGCEVTTPAGPVTICNIHLPSSRQLGPERCAVRRVEEILAAIDNGQRAWDIIAGDFNERSGGNAGRCLQEHGYRDAAVLSGKAETTTNLGGGRGDYIWVSPRLCSRVTDYGVVGKEALLTDIPGKTYLSDHLPLWIRLAPGV